MRILKDIIAQAISSNEPKTGEGVLNWENKAATKVVEALNRYSHLLARRAEKVALETLQSPDGAGSFLTTDDHEYKSSHHLEVSGYLNVPHLAHDIVTSLFAEDAENE